MGRISKAMDDPRAAIAWAFRKTKMMWSDEKYLKLLCLQSETLRSYIQEALSGAASPLP